MNAAIFLIAIMGCGEGDAPCRELRLLETRYQSQAACLAATEAALLANSDADYPVIVAQCRAAGEPPVVVQASEVQLPEPPEPSRH